MNMLIIQRHVVVSLQRSGKLLLKSITGSARVLTVCCSARRGSLTLTSRLADEPSPHRKLQLWPAENDLDITPGIGRDRRSRPISGVISRSYLG